MPVHNYGIHARHRRKDLVDRLADELRDRQPPRGEGPEDRPDIYIEELSAEKSGPLSITVVWTKWEGVLEVQRPAIIRDACKKSGPGITRIVVAAGFTPKEADVLGMELKRKP